ncbi:hypothetical protein HDR58_05020 [bacterium]|nr:hypothetical protein [bacterium]
MQNQINNGQFQNGISSSAVIPQTNLTTNYVDIIQQLQSAIKTDAQRVQLLMQQGTITQDQGQFLMTQLAKKLNEINMCNNAVPQGVQAPASQPMVQTINPMDLFNQENPNFFDKEGRGDILNYIKDLDMDKDEITKIARMVENLENSAVNSYLKKSAHEKSLNDENSVAKSKLTAYAQNAQKDNNLGKIFTRADIGNMSGEEFDKNEKLIMEQVKQGLIK